jgi:hypothetical protein
MTMASLSASLLARKGDAKPAHKTALRVQELFLPPAPAPKTGLTIAPKAMTAHMPVAAKQVIPQKPAAPRGEAKPAPRTAARAKARASKTLRLDTATNRTLRLLAARDGVTQQSLMEQAVKELLKRETAGLACLCGRTEKQH